MLMAQWGQTERLVADPDIWLCYQCADCTTYCPRGARPGDVLAAIRNFIYKAYSVPSFMGKALASPSALPILFAVPVAILLACVLMFAPTGADGSYLFLQAGQIIDFNIFLPHSIVDAVFVTTSLLMLILASVGFTRFWKALKVDNAEVKTSFFPALIGTLVEFIAHTQFRKCEENKPRATAHLILVIGFGLAFASTILVFLQTFIPHYIQLFFTEDFHPFFEVPAHNLPFGIANHIKILGVLGGIGILVGALMLLYRRWTNGDKVGANGYADLLFLYVVFFAGLTGMFAWLVRLSGAAMGAYVIYFLHLVFVFMLLVYLPYSKFAHIVYRTLALTHCRMIGREARSKTTTA